MGLSGDQFYIASHECHSEEPRRGDEESLRRPRCIACQEQRFLAPLGMTQYNVVGCPTEAFGHDGVAICLEETERPRLVDGLRAASDGEFAEDVVRVDFDRAG